MSELVFLKLGGSLITDKTRPYTPRLDKLADLAAQIGAALSATSGPRLVLGHGSGSFGHSAAKEYGTREGLSPHPPPLSQRGGEYWHGFAEVWRQAAALNRFVMDALGAAGLPVIAFPPSAGVSAHDGALAAWDLAPLRSALAAGLLPVIYGDVAFDRQRGGTILSTEDLFIYLAGQLHPARILLAGLEAGVWEDYPARKRLGAEITPRNFAGFRVRLDGAAGADVTGGMLSKVEQMLTLVQTMRGLQVRIFSAEEPGNLERVLRGEALGTLISA